MMASSFRSAMERNSHSPQIITPSLPLRSVPPCTVLRLSDLISYAWLWFILFTLFCQELVFAGHAGVRGEAGRRGVLINMSDWCSRRVLLLSGREQEQTWALGWGRCIKSGEKWPKLQWDTLQLHTVAEVTQQSQLEYTHTSDEHSEIYFCSDLIFNSESMTLKYTWYTLSK